MSLNKNRAKRDLSSAGFSLQETLPGGVTVSNGVYTIGKIEGNVAITRVVLVVKEAFIAGAITLVDSDSRTYFTSESIASIRATESSLTASAITVRDEDPETQAVVLKDPIYLDGVTEFKLTLASSVPGPGEMMIIVDYVQLDTVVGNHTK